MINNTKEILNNNYLIFSSLYNPNKKDLTSLYKESALLRLKRISEALNQINSDEITTNIHLLSKKIVQLHEMLLCSKTSDDEVQDCADAINALFLSVKQPVLYQNLDADNHTKQKQFEKILENEHVQKQLHDSYSDVAQKLLKNYPEFLAALKKCILRIANGEYGTHAQEALEESQIEKNTLLKLFFFDCIVQESLPVIVPPAERNAEDLFGTSFDEQLAAFKAIMMQNPILPKEMGEHTFTTDNTFQGLNELHALVSSVSQNINNMVYNALTEIVGTWIASNDEILFQTAIKVYFSGHASEAHAIAQLLSKEEWQELFQNIIRVDQEGMTQELITWFGDNKRTHALVTTLSCIGGLDNMEQIFSWIEKYQRFLTANTSSHLLAAEELCMICRTIFPKYPIKVLNELLKMDLSEKEKDKLKAHTALHLRLEQALEQLNTVQDTSLIIAMISKVFEKVARDDTIRKNLFETKRAILMSALSDRLYMYACKKFRVEATESKERVVSDVVNWKIKTSPLFTQLFVAAPTKKLPIYNRDIYAQTLEDISQMVVDECNVRPNDLPQYLINMAKEVAKNAPEKHDTIAVILERAFFSANDNEWMPTFLKHCVEVVAQHPYNNPEAIFTALSVIIPDIAKSNYIATQGGPFIQQIIHLAEKGFEDAARWPEDKRKRWTARLIISWEIFINELFTQILSLSLVEPFLSSLKKESVNMRFFKTTLRELSSWSDKYLKDDQLLDEIEDLYIRLDTLDISSCSDDESSESMHTEPETVPGIVPTTRSYRFLDPEIPSADEMESETDSVDQENDTKRKREESESSEPDSSEVKHIEKKRKKEDSASPTSHDDSSDGSDHSV